MTKRISLLVALSIALRIRAPCYGLYVMVRSGFGELKGEDVGRMVYRQENIPKKGIVYDLYRTKGYDIPMGAFKYKDHKNLSVALGGRFDIFDIGGGLGGAYVCTRFTTLEWFRRRTAPGGARFNATLPVQRHKYVHSGSLLYNFTLFVRAEQFETLFEVGYRHIGLHQMFGAKLYGYTIPKLANLHSDQVYVGVGRTF